MKNAKKRRVRRWYRPFTFGAVLGLGWSSGFSQAQTPTPTQAAPVQVAPITIPTPPTTLTESSLPPDVFSAPGMADPLAPGWADPVSRVPKMFGDFVGRGVGGSSNRRSSQNLSFTGVGAEGNFFSEIAAPITLNGPKGPYILQNSIPLVPGGPQPLPENDEATALIRARFPGATFFNGSGEFIGGGEGEVDYNYFFSSGRNVSINLPNPSGGGLVGRNNYFDNGSPLPQDRVYFFYNHVGDVQSLGTSFDVNRYVFGVEKTFLDGRCSFEFRAPFAGTANSDQVEGEGVSVDNMQFGNLGLLLKGVAYRNPNFLVSFGFGVSVPTARDSRLIVDGEPFVAIENEACILQPLMGMIWAPNDRFYAQAGLQFDIDPSGNPVQVANANGALTRVGTLDDQGYMFLSTCAGYWVYQNPGARLSAVALQGELHYDRSFGSRDNVFDGSLSVADDSNLNLFDATTGVICRFGDRTDLSLGVSFPVGGDHLYSWNLIAQLNWRFGGAR